MPANLVRSARFCAQISRRDHRIPHAIVVWQIDLHGRRQSRRVSLLLEDLPHRVVMRHSVRQSLSDGLLERDGAKGIEPSSKLTKCCVARPRLAPFSASFTKSC